MSRFCGLRSRHTHFSVQHAALGREQRGAWSHAELSPRRPGGWSPGWGRAGLGPGRRASRPAPQQPLAALLQPQEVVEPLRSRLVLGQKREGAEVETNSSGACVISGQWQRTGAVRSARVTDRPPRGGLDSRTGRRGTQDGPHLAPSPPSAPSLLSRQF